MQSNQESILHSVRHGSYRNQLKDLHCFLYLQFLLFNIPVVDIKQSRIIQFNTYFLSLKKQFTSYVRYILQLILFKLALDLNTGTMCDCLITEKLNLLTLAPWQNFLHHRNLHSENYLSFVFISAYNLNIACLSEQTFPQNLS